MRLWYDAATWHESLRRSWVARDYVSAETPVCTVVGKSWDFHATEVLERCRLEENLSMIGNSVRVPGTAPLLKCVYDAEHFFDGFKANSRVCMRGDPHSGTRRVPSGSSCAIPMAALCQKISRANHHGRPRRDRYRFSGNVQLGIHCHNDGELAIANSLSAVDAGCNQVQGTINGIGERCGNADLISAIANLAFKKRGYQVLGGRGLEHLTELSRFVYETANLQTRNGQPFVGQSAFAHKGGMHVHAVNKAAHTYEHMQPALVGNERRILVSELSGRSNIAALTSKHNLQNDRALMEQILAEVVRQENRGYQYETATASFDLLVKRCAGQFKPHFETIKYRIVAGDRDAANQREFAEAIIKLRVGDVEKFEAAEGHGPVNALDAALRNACWSFIRSSNACT